MTSVQERLQMKRVPLDKWSTKEKLCLASAVACSGDQNWMSVSRSLKMLCGSHRPSDWFSQKSCAAQYGKLLENVETPKRKKRTASERDGSNVAETPGESILRRLNQERIAELKKIIQEERQLYTKVKEDIILITSGVADEIKLKEMWKQMEQESAQKEKEQVQHAQWLKEREEKKLEMERAWKPFTGSPNRSPSQNKNVNLAVKIKEEVEVDEQQKQQQGTGASPLLTSLLKSPTPPNTQIIQTSSRASASPTITNLLTGGSSTIMNLSVQNSFGSNNSPTVVLPQPPDLSSQSFTFGSDHGLTAIQTAPTLTKLLDIKQNVVHQMPEIQQPPPVPETMSSLDDLQTDEFMETDMDNVGEELLEAFHDLIPENIEDLEGILDENNPIMLEDEILENVMKMNEGDLKNDEPPAECIPDEQHVPEPEVIENVEEIPAIEEEKEEKIVEEEVEKIEEGKVEEEALENKDEIIPVDDSSSNSPFTEPFSIDENKFEDGMEVNMRENEQMLAGNLFEDEAIVLSSDDSPKETNDEMDESKKDNEEASPKQETYEKEDEEMEVKEKVEPEEEIKEVPAPVVVVVEKEAQEEAQEKGAEVKAAQEEDCKMEETPIEEIIPEEEVKEEEAKEEEKPEITEVKLENVEETEPEKELVKIKEEIKEEKPQQSDEELFEDAKESVEAAEKDALEIEKKPSSVAITDTDDDSLIEVIKEEKKTKRDYSRKKVDDRKDDSSVKTTDDDSRSSRKLRDRSESPLVLEEDVEKSKRRYSSTLDSVPNSPATSEDREYRTWKKSILAVYNKLASAKHASLFLRPTSEDEEYNNLILKPIDLPTIKRNVENGVIKTTAEFHRDVMQMCCNTMMVHQKESSAYTSAKEMMQESSTLIESLLESCKTPKEDKGVAGGSVGANKRSSRKGQTRSSGVMKNLI